MSKDNIIFISMDTHKDFCENAYCSNSRDSTPQPLGRITTTKQAITKLVRQLQSKYPNATLHFVYEAEPCGYWIYRLLTKLDHVSYIVAPSLRTGVFDQATVGSVDPDGVMKCSV